MSDRSYLSIGDVLNLLKDEFPDVTISKIRFLESQGLLDPERTPSGYRKFYEADVERLRWILRQQKDHFLPLKVIKGRLDPGVAEDDAAVEVHVDVQVEDRAEAMVELTVPSAPSGPRQARPAAFVPAVSVPAPVAAVPPAPTSASAVLAAGPTSVNLTWEELVVASGLEESEARDLERYGLIVGRPVARTLYYDEDALIVARLAADFRRYGVEARHLRMYKTAAQREAGFVEQIVTPLLKQRNPRSRSQAIQTAVDLSDLGGRLRQAMLRLALRDLTGG